MPDLTVQPDRLRQASPGWSGAAQDVSGLDRLLVALTQVRSGDAGVDGQADRLVQDFRQVLLSYCTVLNLDRARLDATADNYAGCDAQVRALLESLLPELPLWLPR